MKTSHFMALAVFKKNVRWKTTENDCARFYCHLNKLKSSYFSSFSSQWPTTLTKTDYIRFEHDQQKQYQSKRIQLLLCTTATIGKLYCILIFLHLWCGLSLLIEWIEPSNSTGQLWQVPPLVLRSRGDIAVCPMRGHPDGGRDACPDLVARVDDGNESVRRWSRGGACVVLNGSVWCSAHLMRH